LHVEVLPVEVLPVEVLPVEVLVGEAFPVEVLLLEPLLELTSDHQRCIFREPLEIMGLRLLDGTGDYGWEISRFHHRQLDRLLTQVLRTKPYKGCVSFP
jgi:hypothetical protein